MSKLMNLAITTLGLSLVVLLQAEPARADARAVPPPTNPMVERAPFMLPKLKLDTQFIVEAGSLIVPGQRAAAYSAVPMSAVRTSINSVLRPDAFPNSVPALSVLFEADIGGTSAFCAPLVPNQGVRASQCFIDLNADGKFDAGYVTNDVSKGKSLYWGQLWRVAPVPPLPYENAAITGFEPEPMTFFFRRIKGGKAEFQRSFGQIDNSVKPEKCATDGVTICNLGQHDFVFEASGNQLRVKSVSIREPLSVVSTLN